MASQSPPHQENGNEESLKIAWKLSVHSNDFHRIGTRMHHISTFNVSLYAFLCARMIPSHAC